MSADQPTFIQNEFISLLKKRFETFPKRHPNLDWNEIEIKLKSNLNLISTVFKMEETGGEPDVVQLENSWYFVDCSKESPKERRSLCYDKAAWEARKQHKPNSTVEEETIKIGIELLTESEYFELQKLGPFDLKTSSWIATPEELRAKGGALFGDHRFGRTFIYHNGADSYYGSRGFRGKIQID